MRTIEITNNPNLSSDATLEDCVEAIHKCAEANGTESRLTLQTDGNVIFYPSSASNNAYTKGYFAVLYLIDCGPSQIGFASPGSEGWFSISIGDKDRFIDYLEGKGV